MAGLLTIQSKNSCWSGPQRGWFWTCVSNPKPACTVTSLQVVGVSELCVRRQDSGGEIGWNQVSNVAIKSAEVNALARTLLTVHGTVVSLHTGSVATTKHRLQHLARWESGYNCDQKPKFFTLTLFCSTQETCKWFIKHTVWIFTQFGLFLIEHEMLALTDQNILVNALGMDSETWIKMYDLIKANWASPRDSWECCDTRLESYKISWKAKVIKENELTNLPDTRRKWEHGRVRTWNIRIFGQLDNDLL